VLGYNQVGYGLTGASGPLPKSRALLWHGTAESVVDLTQHFFPTAWLRDIRDEPGRLGIWDCVGNRYHALLWSGTAASAMDLHPAGSTPPRRLGCGAQASRLRLSFDWQRSPRTVMERQRGSAVDLNPAGYILSEARAVSAAGQVGFGSNDPFSAQHALVWNGSAESAIDLHPFLNTLGRNFPLRMPGESQRTVRSLGPLLFRLEEPTPFSGRLFRSRVHGRLSFAQ